MTSILKYPNNGNGLSMDHQILTDNGWKYFIFLKDTDKLFTLDLTTNTTSFESFTEKIYYTQDTNMYYSIQNNNKQIISICTINHTFLYKIDINDNNIYIDEMQNIINKYDKFYLLTKSNEYIEINKINVKIFKSYFPAFCFRMPKHTFYVKRFAYEFWSGDSIANV